MIVKKGCLAMKSRFSLATLLAAVVLGACSPSGQAVTQPAGPATPVSGVTSGQETPAPAPDDSVSSGDGVVSSDQTPLPPPTKPNPMDTEVGRAVVDSIDILLLESFPLQVHASLKGNLPDGCTKIGEVVQTYDSATRTFTLDVQTLRPKGMACTLAVVPYEKNVALEVYGLPKGTYTVNANGMTATFEFTSDNILPELATP